MPTTNSTVQEATLEEYQRARELAQAAPRPARVGSVFCGTASWTDATLLKETDFYPKASRTGRARLEHYASHFPFVEVDATYYALLPPANAQNWVLWTPRSFTFDVKSHPVLTGQPMDAQRLPADLRDAILASEQKRRVYADKLPVPIVEEIERRFYELLQPLLQENRFGALHLQFPPWFAASRKNEQYLEKLASRWERVPLAAEFRHASWFEEGRRTRTLDMLTRHHLSLVCVDAPQVENAPPPAIAVTNSRLAIIRFHGKNARGWQKKGASVHERFSYLYSPQELATWVAPIQQLAGEAQRVHVTFNNCYRDYGVLNAKDMAALLAQRDGRNPV